MSNDIRRLVPVVVQDRQTRQVLMLGYANEEAVRLTRATGWAHFFSRSRQRLWKKGETSGHWLPVRDILEDCDQDALLYLVEADTSVCHRDTRSCFGDGEALVADPLLWLSEVVQARVDGAPDEESYTQQLSAGDVARLIQKVGEEALEVVIAALRQAERGNEETALIGEVCDLLYHLTVLLARLHLPLEGLTAELQRRHQIS